MKFANGILTVAMVLSAIPAAAEDLTRERFFDSLKMYYVKVSGWNNEWMSPWSMDAERSFKGAKVEIFTTDAKADLHCPDAISSSDRKLFETVDFSIRTSGNKTKNTPKSSYKIKLKGGEFLAMDTLNLKSMWNDVSQMREALVWTVFKDAGVVAPGHTYAKLCINDRYFGLYSVIEDVDKSFLKARLGDRSKGNLFKGYWVPEDLGPATFEKRGEDGAAYKKLADPDERTYRLKTNLKGEAGADGNPRSYDDLAKLVSELHKGDPRSNEFKTRMESIFDVKEFLRWASVNVLVGAWDNYWGTPANFYIYNAGPANDPKKFMSQPYFMWIPWDYDHTFGAEYWGTEWHYANLLDWGGSTQNYYGGDRAKIPLIERILENPEFRCYYLRQVDKRLNDRLNETWVSARMKQFWDHVQVAARKEADTPNGPTHTGRRWTNDQVYFNGQEGHFIQVDVLKSLGIIHFVRMRYESAKKQLQQELPRCR